MEQVRLLLPFCHTIEVTALEQAIQLAKARNAILVSVSFIYVPKEKRAKGPRLELVQQSQDFLETVSYRAAMRNVSIEKMEILTSDVGQSIHELADTMHCEAIILFMRGKDSVMLSMNDIKHCLEKTPHKLYVFRLEAKNKECMYVNC